MILLRLLLDEGGAKRSRLLIAAGLACLSSVALLYVVNRAAKYLNLVQAEGVNIGLALGFIAATLVYYLAERDLITYSARCMEEAIQRVRTRLIQRLQQADFAALEQLGHAPLFESVTQSTAALSHNSQFIALSCRAVLLTAMLLAYIGGISPVAFQWVLCGTVATGVMYYFLGQRLSRRYGEMMDQERKLFATVADLLDGFREVQLCSQRSTALARHFSSVSRRSTVLRIDTQDQAFQQLIAGHIAFFSLLAIVVFVIPAYANGFSVDVVQVCAAVIFMIGPLGGVIRAVTVLASADAAARRMFELDAELSRLAEPGHDLPQQPVNPSFTTLSLQGVTYHYPAHGTEPGFGVGPLDLVIQRGEIIFITGGNGSGKSSLIKLLTGLYRPEHGNLSVDSQAIGDHNRRAYRELFATVFADQHYFQRLHAVPAPDPEEAQGLLQWLKIDHVLSLHANVFNRAQLSSGQRKRALLVAALLEHKPILVLDEWAADQDPPFRHTFYREILPALRARGLTIIAVTHDDHYFSAADRCLHIENGQITHRRTRTEP